MVTDMDVIDIEPNERCGIREQFDQGLIKNESDENIFEIKVEEKTEMDTDRELINKHKNDCNTEVMSEVLLNRIHYEHIDVEWDESCTDNQEVFEMEFKPEVHIESEKFEVVDLIKTEDNGNIDAFPRIKNEHSYVEWNKFGSNNNTPETKVEINYPETDISSTSQVGEFAQGFIIKHESDENTDEKLGLFLNRIKKEHNYVKCSESDLNIKHEMEVENDPAINIDSEVNELTQELIIKDENDENTDSIVALRRIKNEHGNADYWDECAAEKKEALEIPLAETKPEADIDSEKCKITEITEELMIKDESDASMDSVSETNLDRMAKRGISKRPHLVSKKSGRKSFPCFNFNYTTHSKGLSRYLLVHDVQKYVYDGRALNLLMNRKHSNPLASVSTERTNSTNNITSNYDNHTHLSMQADIPPGYKLRRFINSNATFRKNILLDDHLIIKHPDFITSTSDKVYGCAKCTYKTANKTNFERHMSAHPRAASMYKGYKVRKCIHCNVTFKSKTALDGHVVRKHPGFIASISSKLYECKKCVYKTVYKHNFDRHISTHIETASRHKPNKCVHCNALFMRTMSLDEHIIKHHPDFIASISSKLHECRICVYKTVHKPYFDRHTSMHFETASRYKPNKCVHCNALFLQKKSLDEHIMKHHPDFVR